MNSNVQIRGGLNIHIHIQINHYLTSSNIESNLVIKNIIQ